VTTNDQRRHDTAYLNKRLFYKSKVRRLIIRQFKSKKSAKNYYLSIDIIVIVLYFTTDRTS